LLLGKISPRKALETPIYRWIKYPSGSYNFYHFHFDVIVINCEEQLPDNNKRLQYLRYCRIMFNKHINNTPWLYYPCWIKRAPEHLITKHVETNINGRRMLFPHPAQKTATWMNERKAFDEYLQRAMDKFVNKLDNEIKHYEALIEIGIEDSSTRKNVKKNRKSIKKMTSKNTPIIWLKNERQLTWLLCELSDNKFITCNSIAEVVEKHFVGRHENYFDRYSVNQEVSNFNQQKNKKIPIDIKVSKSSKIDPIIWCESQNTFGYFLHLLHESGYFYHKRLLPIVVIHFIKDNGDKFNINKLSQIFSKYRGYSFDTLPNSCQPIFHIIDSIKNL
jgi:hypothetical protein